MNIKIGIDTTLDESEIYIRCPEVTEDIVKMQRMISAMDSKAQQMVFYMDDKVEFQHTHKIVYVSRNYFKPLKCILDNRFIER
ncbi:hypothetical protein [Aminicella lysinilytica]|jgi:hypothetical protein|nr:hypothetical protein [Aminicella lysinilytica]NLD10964.1 hypothetical protein [Clostridiales bacterium]